jgi:hypothetical protein
VFEMGVCVRCGCETDYITVGSVCSACRHEEEVKAANERYREQREREEEERRRTKE